MSIWRAITSPFTKLFDSLRRAGEQTYCGDSPDCEGLSYQKGNLDQDIPQRIRNWDNCPVPGQEGRQPENSPPPSDS